MSIRVASNWSALWSRDHVIMWRCCVSLAGGTGRFLPEYGEIQNKNKLIYLSFVANFLYYFSLVKTHLFVIDINSSITKLDFISREANLTDNFACLPGGKTRFLEGGYPADTRPPEESSGWIFREVTDAKTPKNLFLSNIFRLLFPFSTKFPP